MPDRDPQLAAMCEPGPTRSRGRGSGKVADRRRLLVYIGKKRQQIRSPPTLSDTTPAVRHQSMPPAAGSCRWWRLPGQNLSSPGPLSAERPTGDRASLLAELSGLQPHQHLRRRVVRTGGVRMKNIWLPVIARLLTDRQTDGWAAEPRLWDTCETLHERFQQHRFAMMYDRWSKLPPVLNLQTQPLSRVTAFAHYKRARIQLSIASKLRVRAVKMLYKRCLDEQVCVH